MSKNEWIRVGKLDRRRCFAGMPTESLHREIRRLAPKATDIQDVGVTPRTNKELRKKLEAYVRKHYPMYSKKHREISVGMEMLNHSPCDIVDGEDFYLYVRSTK